MDVLTPATFKNMLNDPDNPKNSRSSTTQQKRSKSNNIIENFRTTHQKTSGNSMALDPAEKKIEVKLNCQKRLSAFFGSKQPKSPLTCENPEEWDEEFKKALDFSDKKDGPPPSDLSVFSISPSHYLFLNSLRKDFF